MKAFVIRKWWRQLFVVAKQEQQSQAEAAGGDSIAFAWKSHVARKKFRAARRIHVIKCKTLAVIIVQRAIKCHAARVALRLAAAAAAAREREKELGRALVYEVSCGVMTASSSSVIVNVDNTLNCTTNDTRCRWPAFIARWQHCRSKLRTSAASKQQPSSTGRCHASILF